MSYRYTIRLFKYLNLIFIISFIFITKKGHTQISTTKIRSSYFSPADSSHSIRIRNGLILTGICYTGFSAGFYHLWYKKHQLEAFHTFNDWHEWQKMDKVGHLYGAYIQSMAGFKLAKWTGVNDKRAIWYGIMLGTLSQSTIEVMDGFSSKWGFSYGDIGFNILGVSAFALQQQYWKEQKITFKVSNIPVKYPNIPIPSTDGNSYSTLEKRANSLYGSQYVQTFLKDYNAQTIWASFNIKSLFNTGDAIPDWFNIAIGYSGENMFGGFENKWKEGDAMFSTPLERYGQFFIAPDIDFWRIRTKSPLFNTFLDIVNGFHIPLPALEINTKGEFHFHFFM